MEDGDLRYGVGKVRGVLVASRGHFSDSVVY
jgi:hypothetical protein